MKAVLTCFACAVLLCCVFSLSQAAKPSGKSPDDYKTVNDDKFSMLFDGAELSVVYKGDKRINYVCMVSGKLPNIQYNGDYTVTGPRYPKDPEREKVIIKRVNGRNSIAMRQQDKIVAEMQRRGQNTNSPPADLVEQYTTTYDAQSSMIPRDLEQVDKVLRPDIDKACGSFVNYAITRLKSSGGY